jgi:ferredoxin
MSDTPKISKVVVDRNLCIGAAPCTTVAPDAFELDDEGKAVVKPGWTNVEGKTILEAAESCPVNAILVYDDTGAQIYPK